LSLPGDSFWVEDGRLLFSWERIAVVTDDDAYRRMVKAVGFLMPAKVRVFELAALGEAKAWIAASD
jgi:hypothetical protein